MINKDELKQARLQLHQAVQILAACAISFLEKQADDSHTNMEWHHASQSLVTHNFGPGKKFRLSLVFPELKYSLSDKNSLAEYHLDGKTEQQASQWIQDVLKAQGMDISKFTMDKHYQIPLTTQAQGAPYKLFNEKIFKEMTDHFDRAQKVLSQISKEHTATSAIRCWPHHFDLAMLITIEENEDPEQMKSVGLGLSPGDDHYDQPYYYVSPWPYPDKSKLNDKDLAGYGFWHHQGFTSAILLAESYQQYSDIEKSIFDFLSSAIACSIKMITT